MTYTYKTTAEEAATILKDRILGKNILITGVSPKSLGAETLRVLAPYANILIVASRSKERATEAVNAVLKESPSANIKVVALDLGSGESIRAGAAEILSFDLPIHVVINNAAVAQPTSVVRTKEGFESQFGGNHLGHFLLISLLKVVIIRGASVTEPARIVNVSSAAASWGGEIRWDDPNYSLKPEEYSKYPAYAKSKMANILFTKGLAKRFGSEGVLAYSLHPGGIRDTNMGSLVPMEEIISLGLVNKDGTPKNPQGWKTIASGTSTQVIAAFDPSITNENGAYLSDGVIHNDLLPPFAQQEENVDKLWELSERLWGIKF